MKYLVAIIAAALAVAFVAEADAGHRRKVRQRARNLIQVVLPPYGGCGCGR